MTIRLPLTLAIIDGFLVQTANNVYVVPLDMVVECIELNERESGDTLSHDFINLRGEVLPYINLKDHFELTGAPVKRQNIVVVQNGNQKAGLVVDTLIGEFQTVIKPLGRVFSNIRGIGGFTILGTGEVALILDIPRMLQGIISEKTYKSMEA
mgnify:FL=1